MRARLEYLEQESGLRQKILWWLQVFFATGLNLLWYIIIISLIILMQ